MLRKSLSRLGLITAPLAALVLSAWAPAAGDASADAILYICGAENFVGATQGPKRLTLDPGMGTGGFNVRSKNVEAQVWFDQGVKLFHAFYHDDAKVAFDKSVAADPTCSLCLWGQALSQGSTQNYDVSPAQAKGALDIARKAQAIAKTPLEEALSKAMIERYTAKIDAKAETDFAAALLAAAKLEPEATDIPLLASEALLTAWRRGDKPTGDQAVALIEPILKAQPNNTAAIHYYIHATEFAGRPALALPYARKLAGLAPGASHLIHMAAHTFMRVGMYQDAATINAEAMKSDADHLAATNAPGPVSTAFYYQHNFRFGMAGTLMSGDGALGVKFADHLHKAYPDKSFTGDGMAAAEGQRYTIYARYAPDRMLALPEPEATRPVARALYHYARGEAYALKGDLAGLKREAPLVTGDTGLARIERGVLSGRIAMLEGRYDEAVQIFDTAAVMQETLLSGSMDPPPWWYPVRRSVAAAYLKAGLYKRAADEAQRSLKGWPADPMALTVLSQAEARLGKRAASAGHRREAERNWRGALSKAALETI